ncbi:MAG TPA: AAA family ATPase [Bacteroidales bacterium]|nr:AAA family ATPase [Bacteroidales bacterium]HQB21875.1 AAA family ATPase [Bacteroidales bacterium]
MDEYKKFKSLLEYFVAHLEYCVTGDKNGRGFDTYIKNLINDKRFLKSGLGSKNKDIQKQIEKWDTYEDNVIIYININPSNFRSIGNYLISNIIPNEPINIKAVWNKDEIEKLQIYEKAHKKNRVFVLESSCQELGLFDNKLPNDNLKTFFNKYKEPIVRYKHAENMEKYIKLLKESKNLILTGAPGTGKTYLAKEIAKQMIGMKPNGELAKSEQFAFVQFHPSYDYTDFVEGLRPTQPDENGNIGFELKDGVFKEFCKKALEGRIDNFENSWNNLLNLVRDNLAKKQLTKIGSWEYSLSTKDSLKYSSIDTPSGYTFTITKQNVYNAYQGKKARPSGLFQKEMEDVVEFMKKHCDLKNYQQVEASQNKNYVFVIDEINRGEISKIFGELFFSIDPGYRGKKGLVQTQYANLIDEGDVFKGGFYVPENVYIIGTMNDIDRSVESFDFAMRRRFTWEEITSEDSAENMNLPEEIKVKMRSLNNKIASIEGLNSSYHIGGAYFLDSEGNAISDDKMEDVWKLRLRPLLKEYLRGMPDSENLLNDLESVYGVNKNDKTTSKSSEQNDNDNDETEQ